MERTISILGDSYSTFFGYNNKKYDMWYPNNEQGVISVEETWWKQLCDDESLKLIENNSYSGSTICNTGYDGMDSSFSSYVTRITKEMSEKSEESDIFLIFGGTNDFWSGAPIGEIKYTDLADSDLKQFAPAFCYLMDFATNKYKKSVIYVIENDILPDYITSVMDEVCNHFGVKVIKLKKIDKINGHPTKVGMSAISRQIAEYIR